MSSRKKLSAAVIGLGQVGSRFDEEPRPGAWSHTGAYLAQSERFELLGGADIHKGNRERFAARCPDARVFADPRDMVKQVRPDVLSLCTPPEGRADLVGDLLNVHRPRILISEKPLEREPAHRHRLVDACADAGVPLLVNYNRRYAGIYRKVREEVAAGRLGRLTSITVTAPNRLWSIGSHAVNLLLFFAGETPMACRTLPLPGLDEGGEPAADLLCRFPSGAAGRVVTAGFCDMLLIEVDIIGREGRIRIQGNGAVATFMPLENSPQFLNYRTPGEESVLYRSAAGESTFETLANEAADIVDGVGEASSTGADALASEAILDRMAEECMKGNGL